MPMSRDACLACAQADVVVSSRIFLANVTQRYFLCRPETILGSGKGSYEIMAKRRLGFGGRVGALWFGVALLVSACRWGGQPSSRQTASGETSTGAEQGAAAMLEQKIRTAFAQEAPKGASHPIVVEGSFRAQIESVVPPQLAFDDGLHTVEAHLGPDNTVTCYVRDEVLDISNALQTAFKLAGENVEFKRIFPYALKVVGTVPIFGVRGVYVAQEQGGQIVGDYKIAGVMGAGWSVVCEHDQPGYAESFLRVVQGLVESLEFAPSQLPAASDRTEVWGAYLQEVPVGFVRGLRTTDENGVLVESEVSSLLLSRSMTEMVAVDMGDHMLTDKTGALQSRETVRNVSGEIALDITLKRSEEGYAYSGSVQGKPVSREFETATDIKGPSAMEARVADIIASGEPQVFKHLEYLVTIDPSGPLEVTYHVSSSEGRWYADWVVGGLSVKVAVDEQGRPTQIDTPMGAQTLQLKLLARTSPAGLE